MGDKTNAKVTAWHGVASVVDVGFVKQVVERGVNLGVFPCPLYRSCDAHIGNREARHIFRGVGAALLRHLIHGRLGLGIERQFISAHLAI